MNKQIGIFRKCWCKNSFFNAKLAMTVLCDNDNDKISVFKIYSE